MSDNIPTEMPKDAFVPRLGVILRAPCYLQDSMFDEARYEILEATSLSIGFDQPQEILSDLNLCTKIK